MHEVPPHSEVSAQRDARTQHGASGRGAASERCTVAVQLMMGSVAPDR